MRLPKVLVAAALVLGFDAGTRALLDLEPTASADESRLPPSGSVQGRDIQVGDTLQAVVDVELDEAIVAKGSKVSVSGRKTAGGRVLLDVALADGHVVRSVPLTAIRGSFQRVDG